MERIKSIAAEEAAKHSSNIDAAVKATEFRARNLPEFGEYLDQLVTQAIRELVYEARHKTTTNIRNAAGRYGGPQKVPAMVAGLGAMLQSVYDYCIAGTTLGRVLGKELDAIAEDQEGKAAGFEFNAKLCRRLRGIVPDNKSVSECVPEQRLRQLFDECKSGEDAAIRAVKPGRDVPRRSRTRKLAAVGT